MVQDGRQSGCWHPRVAAWRPALALVPGRPPEWLRSLLRERGSLTARLEGYGPVSVQVLREGWGRPAAEEAVALDLPPGRRAWLREVILRCNGGVQIYARSVVPAHPGAVLGALRRLGAQPLGRLLFAGHDVRRGPLRIARLHGREPLSCWLRGYGLPGVTSAWARRSILTTGDQRLLVTEVFLPTASAHEKESEGERGAGQQ